MVTINIRDTQDSSQLARENFRRAEFMEMNAAAAEIPVAAQSPLPPGWNMRDASAALAQREYEARLASAPNIAAWDGASSTQRLEATARTIDAIRSPMGAAGYLVGRGLGVNEGDAAVMAVIGAMAGELLSARAALAGGNAVKLGNRRLPDSDLPWVSYQKHVTGRNYEEMWLLNGSKVALDARRAGFSVEAKWTGRNDAAWTSSPYNPDHRYYDEKAILGQARSQVELNSATGGKGVRFVVSNEAARQHFTDLFERNFNTEMKGGTLQVWHVPGNGMRY
jgi:hypothetical protein